MRIHTYAKCDSCRKAVKWLEKRGLTFEEIPIREQPPSKAELRRMLAIYQGELKRLFNTSGQDYRALRLKDRLPGMSDAEAIDLLASHGNLVKRPFLLTPGGGVTGFREEEWRALIEG